MFDVYDDETIQRLSGVKFEYGKGRETLQKKLKTWFTYGMLDQFGTREEVVLRLKKLFGETELERFFRHSRLESLLQFSQDLELLAELLVNLYPDKFSYELAQAIVKKHFQDIFKRAGASLRGQTTGSGGLSARDLLALLHSTFKNLDQQRLQRKKVILKRLIMEHFF